MSLTQGEVLANRYRIVKLLGQGGFGAVYRVWDVSLAKACAIKENLDARPEAQEQFEREAKILANLNHPNLPRVTDHFFIPGQGQYLVMDYVDGEDLASVLEAQGRVPLAKAMDWVTQVAGALVYLHEQNPPVIHRDVKPANIRVTPKGSAFLVDFGLVKYFDPQLRTTQGARAVTPGYSPPEQYGRGRTDARTDIYALGATLFSLLTGQEPPESVQRMGDERQDPLHAALAGVAPGVAQIIKIAMAVDPARRFQTAVDFCRALEAGAGVMVRPPPRQYVRGAAIPAGQPLRRPVGPAAPPISGPGKAAGLAAGPGAAAPGAKAPKKTWKKYLTCALLALTLFCILPVVGGGVWLFRAYQLQAGEMSAGMRTATPNAAATTAFRATGTARAAKDFLADFDDRKLTEAVWRTEGPPYQIKNGTILLENIGPTFPYFYTEKNPFPGQGNFILEISFRYPTLTNWGVGLVAAQEAAPYGGAHNVDTAFLSIWQNSLDPLTVSFKGHPVYHRVEVDTEWHVLELRYTGKYDVRVDGMSQYTSTPTQERPAVIWFGNPVDVAQEGEWSSLELEYIHVRAIP